MNLFRNIVLLQLIQCLLGLVVHTTYVELGILQKLEIITIRVLTDATILLRFRNLCCGIQ